MGYLLPSVALSTQKKVFWQGEGPKNPSLLSQIESVATKRGDKVAEDHSMPLYVTNR